MRKDDPSKAQYDRFRKQNYIKIGFFTADKVKRQKYLANWYKVNKGRYERLAWKEIILDA